ncbi:MAG: formyltransferase family protein [Hyphomicrobiaceae bacterium]|nr:formyltransferase family protein [Hyphomicrobiaceae bacterium]
MTSSKHEIVGIAESTSFDARNGAGKAIRLVSRRVVGRLAPGLQTLEQYCNKQGIPYFRLTKEGLEKFSQWSSQLAPDILVVYSMSQLLPPAVFQTPKHGAINLHPSFLPEYRGPNPVFWQYFNMVLCPGVTVHYIDAGEDTGDIISQERIAVDLGIRSQDWLDRVIGHSGSRILLKSLEDIENGTASRCSQSLVSPTRRARNIKNIEHEKLIDWAHWPLERIWNLLRGTEEWLNCIPPPSGINRGQRWRIGDYQYGPPCAAPGTVHRGKEGYFIACADGKIKLSVRFSLLQLARHIVIRN